MFDGAKLWWSVEKRLEFRCFGLLHSIRARRAVVEKFVASRELAAIVRVSDSVGPTTKRSTERQFE